MGPFVKWLVFNVIVGLIPYGAVVVATSIDGGRVLFPPSSEILFLALLAFATAFAEIYEGARDRFRRSGIRDLFLLVLALAVPISALLYGFYVHHLQDRPGRAAGVDCAALVGAEAGSVDPSIRARWDAECKEWGRVDAVYFDLSVKVAVVATVIGGFSVLFYGPSRRRW